MQTNYATMGDIAVYLPIHNKLSINDRSNKAKFKTPASPSAYA
jgi:hypothetical protein